jgi:hypothetical protein
MRCWHCISRLTSDMTRTETMIYPLDATPDSIVLRILFAEHVYTYCKSTHLPAYVSITISPILHDELNFYEGLPYES